ncbi:MAG: alpha/beta fold hydrolase [Candidatus Melainabacteria bacterium]|nr:alpha/beta fold hydrolase [Candidatus Melainabacteria bacterium]
MKKVSAIVTLAISLAAASFAPQAAIGGEVTIPSQLNEVIKPELALRYKYIEDGDYSKQLNIPTYEWLPTETKPKAIILGIHGLTLHGRRYRVLARTMAVSGIGFVALDMRGFGKCAFEDTDKYSTKLDNKRIISHEKSYKEVAQLADLIKQKYPDIPIIALGESLGCTFCVRLASERKDLVSGMILSAPAVKVNPAMYASAKDIEQGFLALIKKDHKVSLTQFITHLVSNRPEVAQEMLDDPLILKSIKLTDLISTDLFCEKTSKHGKNVAEGIPVLIFQGGGDRCVSPKSVTELMMNMPSSNQTLAWMGPWGHLQLETSFFRSKIIDVIGDWMDNRTSDGKIELQALEQDIDDLGGTLVR